MMQIDFAKSKGAIFGAPSLYTFIAFKESDNKVHIFPRRIVTDSSAKLDVFLL